MMHRKEKQTLTFRIYFKEPFKFTKYPAIFRHMDFRAKTHEEAFKRLDAIIHSGRHEYANDIQVKNWKVVDSEKPVLFPDSRPFNKKPNKITKSK